jgi:hypothetical protein
MRQLPPWVADAGLAAAVATSEIIGQLIIEPRDLPAALQDFTGPTPLSIAVALLMSAPIIWRRRVPELTMAIIGFTAVGAIPFGVFYVGLGLLVALFSVAAYSDRRTSFVLLGVFMFFAVVAHVLLGELRWAVLNAFVYVGAWALGDRQKTRRAYTAELEEKFAEYGGYDSVRPSMRCWRDHSAGNSQSRGTPMPCGKRPSIAAVTRSGARKESEIVMLTLRTLQRSRLAMLSALTFASAIISASQRRPQALVT